MIISGQSLSNIVVPFLRRTPEGCGGLQRENPGVFLNSGPIFLKPCPFPENAQTFTRIALGVPENHPRGAFPGSSKVSRKLYFRNDSGTATA